MKAAQIDKYSKDIHVNVREIPVPKILKNEAKIKFLKVKELHGKSIN